MKRCIILPVALSLLFGFTACKLEKTIPSDGVWYCAELQAQFTFGLVNTYVSPDETFVVDESKNYVIINGDRIASMLGGDYGATYVWIDCQEPNHPDFYVGEIIYSFKFVSLSDIEYIVEDDAGKRYTFLRIGSSPTDD